MANLSWKLAAVAQGADEALLDTYQSERAPHVREYIDMAIAMGRFINQTGAEALAGRAVEADGDAARLGMIRPPRGPGFGAGGDPAGRLAPHPRLSGGKRPEDVADGRFAVLAPADFAGGDAILSDTGAVLIADDAFAPWLSEIGAAAAVLRPDGYVMEIIAKDVKTPLRLPSLAIATTFN